MLGDRYHVFTALDQLDQTDPTGPFDLCIIDTASLQRVWLQLRGLRERFKPFLLPSLVLADRRDPGLLSKKLWEATDDVLLRPVDRLELALRVQSLTRLRALSLKLGQMTDRYEHELRIAQRLQTAALPSDVQIAGIGFSGVYSPASSDANVGGDWYDALQLPDGRVVFTIGDVSGSGLEAAVTMTNVKQAIRGIAYLHSDPAMILDAADRALNATEHGRIVTAFVAVYDAASRELRYASAGHPPPFLRRANGTIDQLSADGMPLGIPWRYAHRTEKCQVNDGDVLFLYTDGLTEADRDVVEGERNLHRILEMDETVGASNIAEWVYHRMLGGISQDDVAIAAIRFVEETSQMQRWRLSTDDRHAVRAARAELMSALSGKIKSAAATTVSETIVAELIANVFRYAPGEFELIVDLGTFEPVLHVLDRGPGFSYWPRLPADIFTENGRGMFIVAALSPDFTIERRLDGGTHARVVLPRDSEIHARRGGPLIDLDAPRGAKDRHPSIKL